MNTSTLVTAPLAGAVGLLVGVLVGDGDEVVGVVVGVLVGLGDDVVGLVVGDGVVDVPPDEPVLTTSSDEVVDSREPRRRFVDDGVSSISETSPDAGTGHAAVSTTMVTRCPALTAP